MHGRKRDEYKAKIRDPGVASKLASKAKQWYAVQSELLKTNKSGDVNTGEQLIDVGTRQKLLAVTYQLLTVNPDPLWLWNRRRQMLLLLLLNSEADPDSSTISSSSTPGADTALPLSCFLSTELELTLSALQSNPKSYGAWLHRKWVLQQYLLRYSSNNDSPDNNNDKESLSSPGPDTVLQQELELVASLLTRDERNFHGWNYRRFVVSCELALAVQQQQSSATSSSSVIVADGSWNIPTLIMDDHDNDESIVVCWMGTQVVGFQQQHQQQQASPPSSSCEDRQQVQSNIQKIIEKELEFTLSKIQTNFSNFSAFHYRSKLLPILQQLQCNCGGGGGGENNKVNDFWDNALANEMDLVESAIFTEPDDQTAWWYQRFLLDYASQQSQSQQQSQSNTINENDDNNERWRTHLNNLRELVQDEENCKWAWLGMIQIMDRIGSSSSKGDDDDNNNWDNERFKILKKLIVIDPDRKERYRQMM